MDALGMDVDVFERVAKALFKSYIPNVKVEYIESIKWLTDDALGYAERYLTEGRANTCNVVEFVDLCTLARNACDVVLLLLELAKITSKDSNIFAEYDFDWFDVVRKRAIECEYVACCLITERLYENGLFESTALSPDQKNKILEIKARRIAFSDMAPNIIMDIIPFDHVAMYAGRLGITSILSQNNFYN
jgi:hypothetical protein